jgi:hypothetical protein
MKNALAILFALGLFSSPIAHEGHGTPGQGHTLEHYLIEPAHIPAVILVIATALLGAFSIARIVSRRRAARHKLLQGRA